MVPDLLFSFSYCIFDNHASGINSFGGTASLSNVTIAGSGGNGGNQFIVSPLTTTLHNPSNVSLDTVDISLPVIFDNVQIGQAAINVSLRLLRFTGEIISMLLDTSPSIFNLVQT
jgi:hypothetical protein